MKPNLWGPSAWKFIHAIALNYPDNPTEEQKKAMAAFLISLQYILPCNKCAFNYKKHLETFDLNTAVENKTSLLDTTIELHNMVNRINGKKTFSRTEGREEIMKLFEEQAYVPKKIFALLIVIVVILVISLIYTYNNYNKCRVSKL